MTLVWSDPGKTNDGCPVALMQFVKDAIVSGNDLLKCLRRNCDFAFDVSGPNENHIAANFNVRRFLRKVTFVHPLPSHWLNPVSERVEVGPRRTILGKVKRYIHLVIDDPLLPTAPCLRQTADMFRFATPETLPVGRNVTRPTLAAAA